jgi:hypothetical protein
MLLPLLALALAAAADTDEARRRRKAQATIAGTLEEILEIQETEHLPWEQLKSDIEAIHDRARQQHPSIEKHLRNVIAVMERETRRSPEPAAALEDNLARWAVVRMRSSMEDAMYEARDAMVVTHEEEGANFDVLTLSPDRELIVGGRSFWSTILGFDSSGTEVFRIEIPEGERGRDSVTDIAFSPDGTWFVIGTAEGQLRTYSRTGAEISSMNLGKRIVSVAPSPDGEQIAFVFANQSALRIVSSPRGELGAARIARKGENRRVTPGASDIVWSGDGNHVLLFVLTHDGLRPQHKIIVLNASTWEADQSIDLDDHVSSVALSPDKRQLAMIMRNKPDARLKMLDMSDFTIRDSGPVPYFAGESSMSWSPDQSLLALGPGGLPQTRILFLDPSGNIEGYHSIQHGNERPSVVFLDDERLLVATKQIQVIEGDELIANEQVRIYDLPKMGFMR